MKFKKGDIITGLPGNGYSITSGDMLEGKVLSTNGDNMCVEVIKHKDTYCIGEAHSVLNSDKKFKLVKTEKLTKDELSNMPIGSKLVVDRDLYNVFIKVGKNDWCNDNCDHLSDRSISNDLILTSVFTGAKIIEVSRSKYETIYTREKDIIEMTVAEIEKALGYSIKIIKEEK